MHIVLVEDNVVLAKSIVKVLKHEGFAVTHFENGLKAFAWLAENHTSSDLVILDVLLPEMNGFEICRSLRRRNIGTPVLFLTSKNEALDTLTGLNVGADDYLKKPFTFDELLARIRAILRRPRTLIRQEVKLNPSVQIDLVSHRVLKNKKEVHLTAKEFAILSYFLHHRDTLITQQVLYDHIFDSEELTFSNTVEVHIKNLRKKLKTRDYEIPLTTIRGSGYRLDL